jgi:hypothetical protein
MNKVFDIVERVKEQSVNNKIALVLRFSAFVICAAMALNGRPPANAQGGELKSTVTPAAISVVTNEDAQQDLTLARMQEWHVNQETWNAATGRALQAQQDQLQQLRSDFDQSHGEQKVWFGILAAMTGGGIFVQLRKRKQE